MYYYCRAFFGRTVCGTSQHRWNSIAVVFCMLDGPGYNNYTRAIYK